MLGTIFTAIIIIIGLIIVIKAIVIVRQGSNTIIERLGKFARVLRPGLHFVIPIIESVRSVVDMREQVWDYPPQSVITKDNVSTNVDTVMYYYILDPVKSVYEVRNLNEGMLKLTMTAVRNIIGSLTLDELLTSREQINEKLRVIVDEATDPWGVKVTRVELKTIAPPEEILEAMTKQMKAERTKRALILEAEGIKESEIRKAEGDQQAKILRAEAQKQEEVLLAEGKAIAVLNIARAQAEAVKVYYSAIHEGNPTKDLIAIKYLEALEKISENPSNKIYIPYESSALMGSLGAIKELFTSAETKDKPAKQSKE
jgi:regulator of protease activity HflC (stomatin/prohibitin superfamily)